MSDFIFIHIPKNAGTSICRALNIKAGHYKYKELIKKFPNKQYFAVIRNPYDRLVSNFLYTKLPKSFWHNTNNQPQHIDYHLLKNADFTECVDLLLHGKLKHQGWECQVEYLKDNNTIQVSHLLRFENLEYDFKNFCLQNNIMHENLSVLNKSNNHNYKKYYNKALQQKIYQFYQEDFTILNYNKTL